MFGTGSISATGCRSAFHVPRHSLSLFSTAGNVKSVAVWDDTSGYIAIMVERNDGTWRRVNLLKDGRVQWSDGSK